jgi:hypothetical protein
MCNVAGKVQQHGCVFFSFLFSHFRAKTHLPSRDGKTASRRAGRIIAPKNKKKKNENQEEVR